MAVVVAYADDEAEIIRFWPDAIYLESQDVNGYTFSDRFPRPDWFADTRDGS